LLDTQTQTTNVDFQFQDVRLVSLFTSPTGDIIGIDEAGELREATAMHSTTAPPPAASSNNGSSSEPTLVSRSLGLKPLIKSSSNLIDDSASTLQQDSGKQPVPVRHRDKLHQHPTRVITTLISLWKLALWDELWWESISTVICGIDINAVQTTRLPELQLRTVHFNSISQ